MTHLLVFSHLRWDFVYQRPQHLLSRIASTFPVLFVEEPVCGSDGNTLQVSRPAPGVTILRPTTRSHVGGFHDDHVGLIRDLVDRYLRAQQITDYFAWLYTPMALPLLSDLKPRALVYDCMDELSMFKDAPRQSRQREAALLRSAQLVLTGGPSLFEAKRELNDNVLCLPSAVDAAHYNPVRAATDAQGVARAQDLQDHLPRPRLGFFGVIDERLDLELVARLADAHAEWQLVMVGPVVKIDPAGLPQRANILWLGQQPYELLPQLVAGWDLCLLPFALNEATRFISPTKTLEYMAAQQPVVSTAIRDVVDLFGNAVTVVGNSTDFVHACERVLAEGADARAARQRAMAASVAQFSWDDSAARVVRAMQALAPLPAEPPQPAAPAMHAARVQPAAANDARVQYSTVVIGAGPTGLSAAYHLGLAGAGSTTLLLEREPRVGGWCRSIEDNGFTFDYAGHIMFSNDPYVHGLYETLLGDNVHWQNREAWIYSKSTYTRYPFQGALYGLPSQVLTECLVGALEARFGSMKGGPAPLRDGPPRNFEEFIYQVWGTGIARHFAVPYNEKLWATPLRDMETSWLGGRVPLPDIEQMITGALEPTPPPMGPNARFGYPLQGGFQALMDAFLPLLKCDLALGTSVLAVSPSARTITLSDGRVVGYQNLISTMGLPQLIAACGTEAPAEVQASARALRHVSVRCVNLGIARENVSDKHWIYYPEDTIFHRIFVQGNASPHCNPPGGFGVTCEISYGPGKPLPLQGQALIDRVFADCKRVGFLREDDELLTANEVDMPVAYVVYDHDRASHVARIRAWLQGSGIVLRGRYSEWEYYNSDHAFLAGRRAADEVMGMAAPPIAAANS
ncbi:MAG: NAD(P)-binding protein [Steroidobacteraceae bacterium]